MALIAVLLAFALVTGPEGWAASVITGDVTPSLPWDHTTRLRVGDSSDGMLAVDGGSTVQLFDASLGYSSGTSGTATVSGPGTHWTNNGYGFYVGREGSGTLRIEAGGQVASNGDDYIGYLVGSTGVATITDASSQWTNTDGLIVGGQGVGTLNVVAGGQVNTLFGSIGYNAGSTGIASVIDAQWTNDGSLAVGRVGNGVLRVEAGGRVSNTDGYIGGSARATGEVTVTGAGSEWTNSGGLFVGREGSGTLRVEDGGQVSNSSSTIARDAGSTGEAIIIGLGSLWMNSKALVVGGFGNGMLTVADGGRVTAASIYTSLDALHGNGTIAVNGAVLDADMQFDSESGTQNMLAFGEGGTLVVTAAGGDLGVGLRGQGSLTVADGVAVASGSGMLGLYPGSSGAATITGAGTQWNCSSLSIGRRGSGTLQVESGGQLSNSSSVIGSETGASGVVTVTGAGSSWTNSGSLSVGRFGNGMLRVEAGGQVVSDSSGSIGSSSGSAGEVTVTGAGSRWTTTSYLYVGGSGSGTLRVESGGQADNRYDAYLGRHAGSTGVATIAGTGSQWTNRDRLYVGYEGSGTLRVEAGGHVVSNSHAFLGFKEGSTGETVVTGAGSQWNNRGSLSVGYDASGTLAIGDGGLVTVAGVLSTDQISPSESAINMSSGGMLALMGQADDTLTDFLNLVGGTDSIRFWDAAAGATALLTGATYGDDYTLEYLTTGDLAGYTLLTVTAPGPPGDHNGNFVVDGNDFLAWQRGESADPLSAVDLAAWQANFGLNTKPANSVSTVPESGTLLLAAMAAIGIVLQRRLSTR